MALAALRSAPPPSYIAACLAAVSTPPTSGAPPAFPAELPTTTQALFSLCKALCTHYRMYVPRNAPVAPLGPYPHGVMRVPLVPLERPPTLAPDLTPTDPFDGSWQWLPGPLRARRYVPAICLPHCHPRGRRPTPSGAASATGAMTTASLSPAITAATAPAAAPRKPGFLSLSPRLPDAGPGLGTVSPRLRRPAALDASCCNASVDDGPSSPTAPVTTPVAMDGLSPTASSGEEMAALLSHSASAGSLPPLSATSMGGGTSTPSLSLATSSLTADGSYLSGVEGFSTPSTSPSSSGDDVSASLAPSPPRSSHGAGTPRTPRSPTANALAVAAALGAADLLAHSQRGAGLLPANVVAASEADDQDGTAAPQPQPQAAIGEGVSSNSTLANGATATAPAALGSEAHTTTPRRRARRRRARRLVRPPTRRRVSLPCTLPWPWSFGSEYTSDSDGVADGGAGGRQSGTGASGTGTRPPAPQHRGGRAKAPALAPPPLHGLPVEALCPLGRMVPMPLLPAPAEGGPAPLIMALHLHGTTKIAHDVAAGAAAAAAAAAAANPAAPGCPVTALSPTPASQAPIAASTDASTAGVSPDLPNAATPPSAPATGAGAAVGGASKSGTGADLALDGVDILPKRLSRRPFCLLPLAHGAALLGTANEADGLRVPIDPLFDPLTVAALQASGAGVQAVGIGGGGPGCTLPLTPSSAMRVAANKMSAGAGGPVAGGDAAHVLASPLVAAAPAASLVRPSELFVVPPVTVLCCAPHIDSVRRVSDMPWCATRGGMPRGTWAKHIVLMGSDGRMRRFFAEGVDTSVCTCTHWLIKQESNVGAPIQRAATGDEATTHVFSRSRPPSRLQRSTSHSRQ